METKDIQKIVDEKVKEHAKEIQITHDQLEKKTHALKNSPLKNDTASLQSLNEASILKDKIVFHKACILALNDLLETIVKSKKD